MISPFEYSLISIILTICGILFAVYRYIQKIEPKILDVENSETKIDYERNITILENIYKLDWGKHWLPFPICQIDIYGRYVSKFSFIFLDELPRDAKIEFYYYRDQIHEKKLPNFAYMHTALPWKTSQEIYLVSKKYYIENNILELTRVVTIKLDEYYKHSISYKIYDKYIEITNTNSHKIINYVIDLPQHISKTKIDEKNNNIARVEIIQHNPKNVTNKNDVLYVENNSARLRIIIKEIPKRESGQFGKLKIPLLTYVYSNKPEIFETLTDF